MKLTPRELEKLQMHCIGKLAEERKARGVKLNYVETIGYLCAQLHELARDGKTVVELMQLGTKMLTRDDAVSYTHLKRRKTYEQKNCDRPF